MEEKAVETKHGKIVYQEWGKGHRVILFFHGFMGGPIHAGLLAPELSSAGYKVIVPYLPGHGKSFDPPKGFYFADLVDAFLEFADKITCEKLIIVGHSLGGGLAWEMTCKKPNRVEKVILIDPGLCLSGMSIFRKSFNWIRNAFIDRERFTTGPGKSLFPGYCLRPDKLVLLPRLLGLLKSINVDSNFPLAVPVQVYWGKDDGITPMKENRKKLGCLSNPKLILFPGGHNWYHWQEKEFLKAVKDFI